MAELEELAKLRLLKLKSGCWDEKMELKSVGKEVCSAWGDICPSTPPYLSFLDKRFPVYRPLSSSRRRPESGLIPPPIPAAPCVSSFA